MESRPTILLVAFVLALASTTAYAAPASTLARGTRAGHICRGAHAGAPVGDGEYSNGVIEFVRHISCRHALRLARPNYRRILRLQSETGEPTGTFRSGGFIATGKPPDPTTLSAATPGGRRFRFL